MNALFQVDRPLLGLPNRLIFGFDWLQDQTDRDNEFISEFFNSLQVSDNRRNVYAGFLQNELDLSETEGKHKRVEAVLLWLSASA